MASLLAMSSAMRAADSKPALRVHHPLTDFLAHSGLRRPWAASLLPERLIQDCNLEAALRRGGTAYADAMRTIRYYDRPATIDLSRQGV